MKNQQIVTALASIFRPTDAIYLCGQLTDQAYTNPRVLTTAEPSALMATHRQFCINPLTRRGNVDGSIRAQVNVAAYRNFLFESDTIDLNIQRSMVPKLLERLPIRLATYSGSKSIHYIFSMADDLSCGAPGTPEAALMYKQYWEGLRQALESEMVALVPELLEQPKLLDLSTKDPIKLSRLPWADRDGVCQSLLQQGRYITSEEVYDYATKVERATVGPITSADPDMSLATFERLLKARSSYLSLRTKIEMTYKWASNAGMYHEMFKLALWASDLTGVPHKTFDMYCQTHVYPIIKAKGYERDPSIGVFNAYKWKNLG